jgi:hypothetical protein
MNINNDDTVGTFGKILRDANRHALSIFIINVIVVFTTIVFWPHIGLDDLGIIFYLSCNAIAVALYIKNNKNILVPLGDRFIQNRTGNKEAALVLSYIFRLKRNKISFFMIILFYIIAMFCFKIIHEQLNFRKTSIVIIGFTLFLFTKDLLTGYRIRKGLFGTNRTEARELIDFIIKNSDNLDFTDSNGNLRRALLPEAKDAAEERIPGILGAEAPA